MVMTSRDHIGGYRDVEGLEFFNMRALKYVGSWSALLFLRACGHILRTHRRGSSKSQEFDG